MAQSVAITDKGVFISRKFQPLQTPYNNEVVIYAAAPTNSSVCA